MLKIIKAFEKTLLVLIKFLLIFIVYIIFYSFFYKFSPELQRVSRVSTIVTTTFLVVCYVMIQLYGSISFGKKTTKELSLSVILAVMITDIFTFCQLCVMEKRIMSIPVFICVIFVHIITIVIIIKVGNNVFYLANPPLDVVLICKDTSVAERVLRKLKYYQNKYRISRVISVNSSNIYNSINSNKGVILAEISPLQKNKILDYCYDNEKEVFLLPDFSDMLLNNSRPEFFDDSLVLLKSVTGLSFEQRFLKRLWDIVISFLAIIITSPVMLIEAISIKLYDGGKVVYKQERCTKDGKIFKVYKFRTMKENAEKNSGAVLAFKNDSRVTPVGKFFRKTRLDELLQLFNILKGDMSLVGPRPERKELIDKYKKTLPEFEYRLKVKAGLTGYAQIMGKYSTSPKDKLMLDLFYIENYSFILDIKILLQTVITVLMPEKSE